MITRITADIDDKRKTIASLRNKINSVCNDFSLKPFWISISRSYNKGYHIRLFVMASLKFHEIIAIRYALGDDKRRITRDVKRKNARQFLFYKKEYKDDK